MKPTKIVYLRTGRVKRATGTRIDECHGHIKVKPSRADWGTIWVSPEEIAAGSEKPAPVPRKPSEKPKREKRPRKPKPPSWRKLVDDCREKAAKGAIFHSETVLALCRHLEASQTLFRP